MAVPCAAIIRALQGVLAMAKQLASGNMTKEQVTKKVVPIRKASREDRL